MMQLVAQCNLEDFVVLFFIRLVLSSTASSLFRILIWGFLVLLVVNDWIGFADKEVDCKLIDAASMAILFLLEER